MGLHLTGFGNHGNARQFCCIRRKEIHRYGPEKRTIDTRSSASSRPTSCARSPSTARRKSVAPRLIRWAVDQTFRSIRAESSPERRSSAGSLCFAVEGEKHRTIYTAKHQQTMPRHTCAQRGASPPTKDVAVDEAYDGLGGHLRFLLGCLPAQTRSTTLACRCSATVHFWAELR